MTGPGEAGTSISGQLHKLPPVPGDPTAVAMFTAHRINDIADELAHAKERMKVMRKTGGELRHYNNLHLANHIDITLDQANQLKENMLEHYPAEADEWRVLARVMNLANELGMASGYKLNPRSGMISLDLPSGTIPPVPGGVDDHHITVVYLGPDVDDDAFAEACDRAQKAAAAVPGPLKGSVGGIGSFPPGSDGMPVWAGVDLPGADSIRQSLADLSASEHKDWKSHVTLAYVKPGEPLPAPVPQTPVTITHLSVHRGKDVVRFPLGGGDVQMCISDQRVMDLAKSVSPAARASSFAHLLQTILYDAAHAQRHSEAMLNDTDDACWQFDADHAEKHLQGTYEHAQKLTQHVLDNYPAEAKWLRGLMDREQDLSTISGQALDLAHDGWKHQARDAHGRFTRTYSAATVGRPTPISAEHAPEAPRLTAAPAKPPQPDQSNTPMAANPASLQAVARAAIHSRVYTDIEIGKAMEEIEQLKTEAAKTEAAEPRATLAVHLGFIALGVIAAALTAGMAMPLVGVLAMTTMPLVASELAEFHVIGRGRGMKAIAFPLQVAKGAVKAVRSGVHVAEGVAHSAVQVAKSGTIQMSSDIGFIAGKAETGTVEDRTVTLVASALRVGGLDPQLAQQTAEAMLQHWMKTDGWRLRRASTITGQMDHVQ